MKKNLTFINENASLHKLRERQGQILQMFVWDTISYALNINPH